MAHTDTGLGFDTAEDAELDELGTQEILSRISAGNLQVQRAVASCLDQIGELVEILIYAFRHGGTLALVGSGYPGMLGMLQADDYRMRFATEARRVLAYAAPKWRATDPWTGRAEDARAVGMHALECSGFSYKDVLLALDAGGATPHFVIGAMQYAHARHARIAAIATAPSSAALCLAQRRILLDLGPELVRGLNFKTGSAFKQVLDLIAGAAMIGLGKVYRGRIVDFVPFQSAVEQRERYMVMKAVDCDRASADEALAAADRRPRLAILMVELGIDRPEAEALLARSDGHLSRAVAAWRKEHSL